MKPRSAPSLLKIAAAVKPDRQIAARAV